MFVFRDSRAAPQWERGEGAFKFKCERVLAMATTTITKGEGGEVGSETSTPVGVAVVA